MSKARIVERYDCAERVSSHHFEIDEWDFHITEVSTGLSPSVRRLRDYVEFSVHDADDAVICRSSCSWQVRDLTPEETERYAATDIVAAVTWYAGWSPQWDVKPLHPALTKDFVIDFFCFYKIIVGKGKKVGDTWKDVIVYVELSMND